MKIGIMSDLHLEFEDVKLPMRDHDFWINAGDTHPNPGIRSRVFDYFNVNVMGNHDYYAGDFPEKTLDCGIVDRDGIKFAYATLWTKMSPDEYELYVRGLVDSRWIRGLSYTDYSKKHEYDLEFLRSSGADVIVTHHSPFLASIAPEFAGSALNCAFHSDLEEYVFTKFDKVPRLWVHGHTHTPCDYVLRDKLRVVCHPRGYPGEKNHNGYAPKTVEL